MTSSLAGYNGLAGPSGKVGNKLPSGTRVGQIAQFDPHQMKLYESLFSHAGPGSFLSQLASGQPEAFEQLEGPALRQFQGQLGGLASRFSGMGTGARKSSGFQNTATAAASNFAQDLQTQRLELQRQAIQDLRGLSSDLLNYRPYEQFTYEKPKKGLLGGWGSTGGAIVGGIGGTFFGNPLLGASVGSAVGGAIDQPSGGGQGMNFGATGGFGSFRNPFGGGGYAPQYSATPYYDALFKTGAIT